MALRLVGRVTGARREKTYTPKVFSALKTQVPQQAKKRFAVYQKACFQGRKKENTYTPKSLQGVCGGLLRAVLVNRFCGPPKEQFRHFRRETSKNPPKASWGLPSLRARNSAKNPRRVEKERKKKEGSLTLLGPFGDYFGFLESRATRPPRLFGRGSFGKPTKKKRLIGEPVCGKGVFF